MSSRTLPHLRFLLLVSTRSLRRGGRGYEFACEGEDLGNLRIREQPLDPTRMEPGERFVDEVLFLQAAPLENEGTKRLEEENLPSCQISVRRNERVEALGDGFCHWPG